MATFPQNPITGSPLIGSPITVYVVPQTHQQQWTFHRVMLRVYAALVVTDENDPNYPSDTDYTALEFSQPVSSSDVVQMNIESALQAVCDRYQAAATPPTQNAYVKFRIVAWDEYMYQGTVHQTDEALLPGTVGAEPCYYYAFMGEFSDFERFINGSDNRAAIDRWTRKPTDVPEVVFCGEEYVRPTDYHGTLSFDHASETVPQYIISGAPTDGPKSERYTVTDEGLVPVGGSIVISFSTFGVYAIQKPADGYVLRFRNLLGCIESLHLRSLPKKTVPIQTEKYTIARRETFSKFSRGLTTKNGNREEWRMTSGAVSEAWAAWYVHELMMVEEAWIKVNAQFTMHNAQSAVWLPVHIVPEETVTLEDRTKAQPLEVQFTLQMDIGGSPLSALAI